MRILAIETSGTTGSLAALDRGDVLASAPLDPALRSARALAPGMRNLLSQIGWRAADVALVAVAVGPGSFTGLRLGVMTAKAFAYGVGARIVGVDTLSVIATQAPGESRRIAAAIDAQRGEVYCATFSRETSESVLRRTTDIEIVAVEPWLAGLEPGTVITGPALAKPAIQVPGDCYCSPRETWFPTATTVGKLAALRAAAGEFDDIWRLAPLYLRRSAAEEKRDASL